MRLAIGWSAISLLAAGLTATPASASPPASACATSFRELRSGPLAPALRSGQLGDPRRACILTQARLTGGGAIVIQPDEFYGDIVALGRMEASLAAAQHIELFAAVEAVRFERVISSVQADSFGLGHSSLGASLAVHSQRQTHVALSARLVLPTAVALYEHSWPVGLDVGLNGQTTSWGRFHSYGHVGVLGEAAVGTGPSEPRAAVVLTSGGAYQVLNWLALVMEARGSFGYAALLDTVALGGGLRLGFGRGFDVELAALFPVAGRERLAATAALSLALRP